MFGSEVCSNALVIVRVKAVKCLQHTASRDIGVVEHNSGGLFNQQEQHNCSVAVPPMAVVDLHRDSAWWSGGAHPIQIHQRVLPSVLEI